MPERGHGRPIAAGLLSFLTLLALGPAAVAFDTAEYEKAARAILCDCGCHPQSTYACACGRAAEMRKEIALLVESGPQDGDGSGMSGDEVIAWYVEQFGEKVRVVPTKSGFNLVAWIGPFIGLLAASSLLLLLLRRWSASAASAPDVAAVGVAPDDPYLARLHADLEKLE